MMKAIAAALTLIFALGLIFSPTPIAAQPAEGEEIELDGLVFERPDGTFLRMTMEGVMMHLTFFDEEKEQIAPDVDRARVRVTFAGRGTEMLFLSPGPDGMALTANRILRHPHVFKVMVHLFRGESSDAVESYSGDYVP